MLSLPKSLFINRVAHRKHSKGVFTFNVFKPHVVRPMLPIISALIPKTHGITTHVTIPKLRRHNGVMMLNIASLNLDK